MLLFESIAITLIALIVAVGMLIALIEEERPFIATVVLFILLGAYFTATKINPITYIAENIFTILAMFLGYVLFGMVWSVFKFRWFVSDIADRYREWKNETLKNIRAASEWPEAEWANNARRVGFYRPEVSKSKNKIYGWMMFWPLSLAWFVLHEPVTRTYKYVYGLMNKTYHAIVAKYFDEFKELK